MPIIEKVGRPNLQFMNNYAVNQSQSCSRMLLADEANELAVHDVTSNEHNHATNNSDLYAFIAVSPIGNRESHSVRIWEQG